MNKVLLVVAVILIAGLAYFLLLKKPAEKIPATPTKPVEEERNATLTESAAEEALEEELEAAIANISIEDIESAVQEIS